MPLQDLEFSTNWSHKSVTNLKIGKTQVSQKNSMSARIAQTFWNLLHAPHTQHYTKSQIYLLLAPIHKTSTTVRELFNRSIEWCKNQANPMYHAPSRATRSFGILIHVLPISHTRHTQDSISFATCHQWSVAMSSWWHHHVLTYSLPDPDLRSSCDFAQ